MKGFDWKIAEERHSKVTFEFLKEWHDKPITEEQFALLYSQLPREGKLHAHVTRSPHAARHQYRGLKEKFGFFQAR